MKKILIATGNEGKRKEMLEVLSTLPDIEFLSLKDFPNTEDPEEIGNTFEENAFQKAQHFANFFEIPTLGEDSGLVLEAFPEKFGVRTRREFAHADDQEWLRLFLELLDGAENRRATFYSASAFFDPRTRNAHTELGMCSGTIAEFPQAPLEPGIPVSAVFIPDGHDLVYSAMDKKQKNAISHRGWSMKGMKEFLNSSMQNCE